MIQPHATAAHSTSKPVQEGSKCWSPPSPIPNQRDAARAIYLCLHDFFDKSFGAPEAHHRGTQTLAELHAQSTLPPPPSLAL